MFALPLPVRTLAKSPGFTLIALATLALGIGVNTSMFSVVETLLFRDGPFPAPERIVQILGATPQGEQRNFSVIELREIGAQPQAFASLATIGSAYTVAAEPDRPTVRLSGIVATAELFTTFGVQPILGRAFTAEEVQPGRNRVIVLSYACWQTRYGGAADVLGHTLRLDGETVEIIGVMPASFDYQLLWHGAAYWRPLNFAKDQIEWRDYRAFNLIGRLAPGATPAQAAAGLAPVARTQAQSHPETYTDLRYRVLPLHETLMDQLGRKISWMLLALSGFVLLIACANLANLQLARAAAGTRDLAIRASLGASRSRLILHQLNECLVLALAGGALGLWLAYGLNRLISRHLLIGGRAGLEIPIDGSILLVALAVSLLTGVVFGIVPAWLATRIDLNAALKSQTRGSTTGRGHHLLRRALVVAEVALALVLLAGAGIMQRGFARFLQHESGWDTAHVLTATLGIPEHRFEKYPDRVEYFRRLETRLAALPGVDHAAIATSLPVHGYNGERPVLTEQQSAAEASKLPVAFHVMVTTDYFAALGISFVEGQSFPADLKADGPQLIILNESLARQLWPNESAVGRRLASIDSGKVYWYEVSGVVRDVGNAAGLRPPSTRFTIYKPLCQEPWSWVTLVLRARAPGALADSLRRAAVEVDPELPADGVGTVPQMIQQSQYNLRLAAKALAAFALLGLLLAAVGIYGVISNLVAQRTPEFGIRLALGAQPRAVQALVLGHGLRLTLVGLGAGLAGAVGLAWMLSRLMPRLASPDPLALALVSLLLLVVALAACFVPARRATKVDPLIALRAE